MPGNATESEQTIIAKRLAGQMLEDAMILAKEWQVPPGQEIVSYDEIRRRFAAGTEQERRELIAIVGPEQMVTILSEGV